jgi:hypothetical protein
MAIKIGDKVRFLNATGGGTVSKIINKELIEVTDEDGFDIPTMVRECVIIENAATKEAVKSNEKTNAPTLIEDSEDEYTPEDETPEGENLNVWLAFLPMDIKTLSTTSYESYLINDSNYYLLYNIITGNKSLSFSRSTGIIPANSKKFIEEIRKDQLNDLESIKVQLIAFKKAKAYNSKPTYDVSLKINPVKFYKLHSFAENDFFEEPALLTAIVSNNRPENQNLISVEENISSVIREKERTEPVKIIKKKETPEIIEVDLHIHELVDNINGLTNKDMLDLQLQKFHQVLEENKKKKGQKIVFIHGKGEGILRNEILKQLKNKYPGYQSQDASFKEYGFGATLVVIK